jgi:hypothetical protein
MLPSAFCWNFDLTPDESQLITSYCPGNQNGPGSGTSNVVVQSPTGGNPRVIYSSHNNVVTGVRALDNHTLLLSFGNSNVSAQTGLWRISLDGTGLTRIADTSSFLATVFSSYSCYPWSAISRDGKFYVVETAISQVNTGLDYGSTGGGPLQAFGTRTDGMQYAQGVATQEIVGWTLI